MVRGPGGSTSRQRRDDGVGGWLGGAGAAGVGLLRIVERRDDAGSARAGVHPVPDARRRLRHSFRKTLAKLVDDRGLSARIGADHLGHSKVSMTQDVYMARGKVHTGWPTCWTTR
jgi:integrase